MEILMLCFLILAGYLAVYVGNRQNDVIFILSGVCFLMIGSALLAGGFDPSRDVVFNSVIFDNMAVILSRLLFVSGFFFFLQFLMLRLEQFSSGRAK